MNYVQQRMAAIFNEWAKRYSESPEEFTGILDGDGKPFEDYGQRCAAYFDLLADEMDSKGVLPVAPPATA